MGKTESGKYLYRVRYHYHVTPTDQEKVTVVYCGYDITEARQVYHFCVPKLRTMERYVLESLYTGNLGEKEVGKNWVTIADTKEKQET